MGMMRQAAAVTTATVVVAVLAGCASQSHAGATAGTPSPTVSPSATILASAATASMLPSLPSATASGTTAPALCRTALGLPGTSTMVTVANIRDYATGPAAKSDPKASPALPLTTRPAGAGSTPAPTSTSPTPSTPVTRQSGWSPKEAPRPRPS